jgi:hypothetical protein
MKRGAIAVIITAAMLIFLFYGGYLTGEPDLAYEAVPIDAAYDDENHSVTYTLRVIVANNGEIAASGVVVTVPVTTPFGAPEWTQASLVLELGKVGPKEAVTATGEVTLYPDSETYALLKNGTMPRTGTVIGTYQVEWF